MAFHYPANKPVLFYLCNAKIMRVIHFSYAKHGIRGIYNFF